MNSTEKVLWVLKRLGEHPFEMGLTDLAREMGYEKSGIYKILNMMVKDGFIVQNSNTKKYFLGPALYRLGIVYSEQKGIWELAKPVMKEIVEITQETVTLGIREGMDAILAYKLESTHEIRLHGKVGKKYPINAGSMGKVLAAYHDPKLIQEYLKHHTLEKKTDNTIIDKEKLLEEYALIRQQGYATSNEENTVGGFGIAAPIYDKEGSVWTCLCLAGPKSRFTDENIKSWVSLVIDGAREISYRQGYKYE
ncbi:MAG: IclR family transcriptional regulator [Bacillota bacterium]